MIRLRKLLKMNGQERYDALAGRDWDLVEFLAASRRYESTMPAWKFWPKAIFVIWPRFRALQLQDQKRKAALDVPR